MLEKISCTNETPIMLEEKVEAYGEVIKESQYTSPSRQSCFPMRNRKGSSTKQ